MAGEPSPPDVLVTGATTADFYFDGTTGGTVGTEMEWIPGGIGTSVARALALLDEPPLLATRLGDDSFATAIGRQLDAYDVPRTLVTETTADTPLLFYVPEAAGGPRWETRIDGSSFGFDIPDWSESLFANLSVVHLTGTTLPPEIGLDAMRTAVEYATAHDVDVSFDTNCRPNQWSDLSKYTDLAAEMLAAADVAFASTDDLALAGFDEGIDGLLAALPERASAIAFLTEGGDGATAVRVDDGSVTARYSLPGFDVDVVDPAAGGDAFASAVLAALGDGNTDLETLVEVGNAAGAAAVTSMGPLRKRDMETFGSLSGGWLSE
ncbi:MAG TPA: carbohydrate kinase family protein [Natrialbaceae archaeon]|nr:carbohydrate kinase family protein [Natrialbaceae archaeon]